MTRNRRGRRYILAAAAILALALTPRRVSAQAIPLGTIDYRPDGIAGYAEDIPAPDEVLGYRIGTRHTRPDELVKYFRTIARLSDRVTVARHAVSYEGRPLIHATVTSVSNQTRIEEIRTRQLRLSDDPAAVSDEDLAGMPAVVYLGYSVHGNEASGSEAAVLLLYHLAAGRGPAVEALLDSTVVIIDPSLNPDGRARFVDWVNGQRGAIPNADGQDREHIEPWPGGRTNHYWFDLNRDWLPAQHLESRGRLALFHRWRPQFLADFHEMGGDATYFFQPGIPSRNNPNTPPEVYRLTARLAEFHARALDRVGSLYYTRESFDDFYYGKGSTYPDVNGAVGILFEQASSRALERETVRGRLTYARTILNQFVTSLSTLAGVRAMRLDFLRHQRDFYRGAPEFARRLPVKAYLVPLDPHRTRAQALVATLQRHRVEAHELAAPVTVGGRELIPGQALVIPVAQPQVRFLVAAMERVTSFTDSLFYDVSTWSLPLAFGVDVVEYRDNPAGLLGALLPPVGFDGGSVEGSDTAYAYVMDWGRFFAPRALYRLLDAGIHPIVATAPFTAQVASAGGRESGSGAVTSHDFDRGAVIIPARPRDLSAGPSPAEIRALVELMAREDHVTIHGLTTGLTPRGPDLGARSGRVVQLPRVALITGDGVSAGEAGEIWYHLTERLGIPVTLLDGARLESMGAAALARYNRLVAVSGFRTRDSATVALIDDWIADGGVFIAQRGAVDWVLSHGVLDEERREQPADTAPTPYGGLAAARGARQIGGSIFEVILDPTHPLAFGYGRRAAVFRSGTRFLEPSSTPGATVARYGDSPLLSGYVSPDNLGRLAGGASIIARRKGAGAVILFLDDPDFRAFWYGTAGLFSNAILLGGSF